MTTCWMRWSKSGRSPGWIQLPETVEAAGQLGRGVTKHPFRVAGIGNLVGKGVPVEEHLAAGADRGVVAIGPLDALDLAAFAIAEVADDGREKFDFCHPPSRCESRTCETGISWPSRWSIAFSPRQ